MKCESENCKSTSGVRASKFGPEDSRPHVCRACEKVRKEMHDEADECARGHALDAKREVADEPEVDAQQVYDEVYHDVYDDRFARGIDDKLFLAQNPRIELPTQQPQAIVDAVAPEPTSETVPSPEPKPPEPEWDPKQQPDEVFLQNVYQPNLRGKAPPSGARECLRLTYFAMTYFGRQNPVAHAILTSIAKGQTRLRELAEASGMQYEAFRKARPDIKALQAYRNFVGSHIVPDCGDAFFKSAQPVDPMKVPLTAEERKKFDFGLPSNDEDRLDGASITAADGGDLPTYEVEVEQGKYLAAKRTLSAEERQERRKGPVTASGKGPKDDTPKGRSYKGSAIERLDKLRGKKFRAARRQVIGGAQRDDAGSEPEDLGDPDVARDAWGDW